MKKLEYSQELKLTNYYEKYLIILAIFQTTKTIAQNTEENSPHRGADPCARPQIETNPFAPQNTEWYSQRNLFNWMDYVTWHNGDKFAIPYYDKQNLYGNGTNSIRNFTNPFLDFITHWIKLLINPQLYYERHSLHSLEVVFYT